MEAFICLNFDKLQWFNIPQDGKKAFILLHKNKKLLKREVRSLFHYGDKQMPKDEHPSNPATESAVANTKASKSHN